MDEFVGERILDMRQVNGVRGNMECDCGVVRSEEQRGGRSKEVEFVGVKGRETGMKDRGEETERRGGNSGRVEEEQ